MKKILLFAAVACIGLYNADAAVRTQNSPNRNSANTNQSVSNRKGASSSVARTTNNVVSRATKTTTRTEKNTLTSRSAATRTTNISSRSATAPKVARTATNLSRSARVSTARATTPPIATNTFGTGYNVCRDAYFTCMDQFCATQNDTYRRCVCSSKLSEIQSRENALMQTANQLQDFKDLNIAVIPKTGDEVKAMLTASEGEAIASAMRDKSDAIQQLAGISAVLSTSKTQSLSTLGKLDIAGDINEIWATTDLASGANIANLYGEALYNAVHSQCANLIADSCESTSTLNMVVSAYGMYIENDCALLITSLDKRLDAANGTIRATEREMNDARLDNYNAHNSTAINECIAQVRSDITADTACGKDYVHCLDVTGRYLTHTTGEPIYSPEFYQLEAQISLSGNILTNTNNRSLVAELNRKRIFAERGLETCRDLADEVWDEFMRQAITEIYQHQQAKVREVKTECLDVVNQCYDEQSQSLKDFSNVKDQMLIGARLELSEEMCREKLYACSNLYGEGDAGMELLLAAMHNITDQKIANNCQLALKEYAQEMCMVPSNDTLHKYPYGCRVYAPGSQQYATNYECNQQIWGTSSDQNTFIPGDDAQSPNVCHIPAFNITIYNLPKPTYPNCSRQYTSCKPGYYLAVNVGTADAPNYQWNTTPQAGNVCAPCPTNACCDGGTAGPYTIDKEPNEDIDDLPNECGDYAGSLYQKLVRYAIQTCVRPSESSAMGYVLPTPVLEDVNVIMDTIRADMGKSLATECERLNGTWVATQWTDQDGNGIHDTTDQILHKQFYDETGSNTKWGFCAHTVSNTESETPPPTDDTTTDTTTQ